MGLALAVCKCFGKSFGVFAVKDLKLL